MEADLEGTVDSLQLSPAHLLWPIFEAIQNSIDAIQERAESEQFEPLVEVEIVRDEEQVQAPGIGTAMISGAVVRDNGSGLSQRNWAAFRKLYTRNKAKLGGRGVGRLTWLKVFKRAEVESTYLSDRGAIERRAFTFSLPDGIGDEGVAVVAGPSSESPVPGTLGTVVSLVDMRDDYAVQAAIQPDTVARRVVEHFLTHFILRAEVPIVLTDGDRRLRLKESYDEMVEGEAQSQTLEIDGHTITLQHFMVRAFPGAKHQIRWCARNRVVTTETLNHASVAGLGPRIDGLDGQLIYYCYVTSPLLTDSSNQTRTQLSLFSADSAQAPTVEKMRAEVIAAASKYLEPWTEERRAATESRLSEFVQKAPQYRYVIRQHSGELSHIAPDIDDRRLESELARLKAQVAFDAREEARKLLAKGARPSEDRLEELTAIITATQRAELAGYVAHRRLVLDLLREALRLGEDGKYPYERDVHKLVFPMRADSDDLTGLATEHNLWAIDERLAFYSYIGSDKEFRETGQIDVPEEGQARRPDLIALDRAAAFGFGDELELRGVTLVEFKRAEGLETSRDDPVERLLEYTRLIRSGRLVGRNGQSVEVPENTPIYGFAVCKITPNYRRKLTDTYQAQKMADGSWFLWRDSQRLQIHVVPYRVLLLNAEKRNAVFFDKAGLPTTKG